MKVRDILSAKGSNVVTVRPTTTLGEVVAIFVRRQIASVIVVNAARQPLGIVTDRIVIDSLARHSAAVLTLSAADVMESPIPHCAPGDSVSRIMWLMTELRARHLMVEEAGTMLGLISIGDVLRCRLRDTELENRVLRDMAVTRHITT